MKPKYIICENKTERDAVLGKLERQGYVWVGEGEKPTEWNYSGWEDDEAIYFNLSHSTRKISWGNVSSGYFSDEPEMLKITANKFLCNNKPILITRKGRVVTAENKNTGEKAIATCSTTDTFDFGTGAMIAVARLMAKTPEALTDDVKAEWKKVLGIEEVKVYTDDDRNFKVGDRVVVRDWGDMAKEYGTEDNCDCISPDGCSTQFTTIMKHLCGRTATITDVDNVYVRVEFDDKSGDTDWYFRRWMFNPSDSDKPTTKFKVGDLVTLKNDLEPGKTYGDMTLYHGDMFDSLNGKSKKVIKVWERSKNSPAYQTESEWYYSEEMLEPWDENKIREGDIVKVINTGLNYSTYPQWVGKYISDPDMAARYCYSSPNTERKYKVLKIAEHEFNGRMLAFIEECNGFGHNRCYLIEVKGLEKVTE